MAAGNRSEIVRNVIPDVRNESVGVCGVFMNGRNGCIYIYCEFLLEAEG